MVKEKDKDNGWHEWWDSQDNIADNVEQVSKATTEFLEETLKQIENTKELISLLEELWSWYKQSGNYISTAETIQEVFEHQGWLRFYTDNMRQTIMFAREHGINPKTATYDELLEYLDLLDSCDSQEPWIKQ